MLSRQTVLFYLEVLPVFNEWKFMTRSSICPDGSAKEKEPGGLCKDGIPHRGLNSRGGVLSTEGSLGDGGVDSWRRFRKHSVPF